MGDAAPAPADPQLGVDFVGGPDAQIRDGVANVNEDPNDPQIDRFNASLKKIGAHSAFGVFVPDVIKARTGGKVDYFRDIQISIRKQYFTFSQVSAVAMWASFIALAVGAGAVAITADITPDLLGESGQLFWSTVLTSASLCILFVDRTTVRAGRYCAGADVKWEADGDGHKKGDPKVDREYQGRSCLSDWDCTKRAKVAKGSCASPKPFKWITTVRTVIIPVVAAFCIAFIIFAYTQTSGRLPETHLVQAICYGLGAGTVFSIIFS